MRKKVHLKYPAQVPETPRSTRRRMTFRERRQAILQATIFLLEGKNPQDVTTKDIADAAQISEALLYQHFKSKEDLFDAVHDVLCQRIPALDRAIDAATPSTQSLVLYFYLLAWISIKRPTAIKIDPLFPRLMMQSIMGDRSFALLHEERRLQGLCDLVAHSLIAAQRSADLQPGVSFGSDLKEARLAFWFGVHLITMVYLNKVGEKPHSHYPENLDELIDRTMGFLLLGVGLKRDVIEKYYQAKILEDTVMNLISNGKIREKGGVDVSRNT